MYKTSQVSKKRFEHPLRFRQLLCLLVLFLNSLSLSAQEYWLKKIETYVECSFRGLSVVDNNVAWIGGTKGNVGTTLDGGINWNFTQVKGFEKSDFRTVYAFDRDRAIIANAGSPAVVLSTDDAGKNWKTVYRNDHKDAFIDGVDFWNVKEGIVYGDPIDGKMLVLRTSDGGLTWTEVKTAPHLETGEASFAASGTGIRCTGQKDVTICTGGIISRLWISSNKGESWTVRNTPIIQGQQTTGIFSFIENHGRSIIVGGDYKSDSLRVKHNFYSDDNGQKWLAPAVPTYGYRECVEALNRNILLAVGPSGLDISRDNGVVWEVLSKEKEWHVVRKARQGSLIIVAGGKGRVFLIQEH